jgi:hypothetical protein
MVETEIVEHSKSEIGYVAYLVYKQLKLVDKTPEEQKLDEIVYQKHLEIMNKSQNVQEKEESKVNVLESKISGQELFDQVLKESEKSIKCLGLAKNYIPSNVTLPGDYCHSDGINYGLPTYPWVFSKPLSSLCARG